MANHNDYIFDDMEEKSNIEVTDSTHNNETDFIEESNHNASSHFKCTRCSYIAKADHSIVDHVNSKHKAPKRALTILHNLEG